MWFNPPRQLPDWSAALAHLRAVEPRFRSMVDRVGPCLLTPRRDYFIALCQAIFAQQVSTAVATTLFGRFRRLLAPGRPTPRGVLLLSDEQLRSAGLSRQKTAYLRDLAGRFAAGQIPTRSFARMEDEQIIAALTAVKGIGRWTAEMFLIFVLNRPDLFPVDDLGVRKAVQTAWSLAALPDEARLERLAAPWRPWRTVATWYLWRSQGIIG